MSHLKPLKLLMITFFCILTITSCATRSNLTCNTSCTDNDINTAVQVKIAADTCLYYQYIRVSTYERTVTLDGKVENPTQVNVAGQLAASVPGVKSVINKLKVKGKYNI